MFVSLVALFHVVNTKVHSFRINQSISTCAQHDTNQPSSSQRLFDAASSHSRGSTANDNGETWDGDVSAATSRNAGADDGSSRSSSSALSVDATAAMDDSGSDLTDRFKYKVRQSEPKCRYCSHHSRIHAHPLTYK